MIDVDSRVNLDGMPQIHVLDVTNRDGVQTARTGLSKFGKTMVNLYLGRLGVAQSEIGFPFLFHEVPYVRAQVALARAGAFGDRAGHVGLHHTVDRAASRRRS